MYFWPIWTAHIKSNNVKTSILIMVAEGLAAQKIALILVAKGLAAQMISASNVINAYLL